MPRQDRPRNSTAKTRQNPSRLAGLFLSRFLLRFFLLFWHKFTLRTSCSKIKTYLAPQSHRFSRAFTRAPSTPPYHRFASTFLAKNPRNASRARFKAPCRRKHPRIYPQRPTRPSRSRTSRKTRGVPLRKDLPVNWRSNPVPRTLDQPEFCRPKAKFFMNPIWHDSIWVYSKKFVCYLPSSSIFSNL